MAKQIEILDAIASALYFKLSLQLARQSANFLFVRSEFWPNSRIRNLDRRFRDTAKRVESIGAIE